MRKFGGYRIKSSEGGWLAGEGKGKGEGVKR